MFQNNLKTALRSLLKRRGYAMLNVAGLAIGLACFGFITVWVDHQRSYDEFHEHSKRIYRVAGQVYTDSETFGQAVTCAPMAAALQADFPEVEAAVRLDMNDAIVRYKDRQFKEDGLLFTDPSFFEVFSFRLLKGNPATALAEPYTVVLTESMAKKYFGDADPLEKTMTIFLYDPGGTGAPYRVTGIVADPPEHSHFDFTMLGSFSTAETALSWLSGWQAWFSNFMYTYVLLEEGASPAALEGKLPGFAYRHMGEKMEKLNMQYTFSLQPLENIYLHSDLRYEIGSTGDAGYLPVFSIIGLFILLLACINYMNLATARSSERVREIGMRKILGARRRQLLGQFLAESVMVALLAAALALTLMQLLFPAFQRIADYPEAPLFNPSTTAILLGASLAAGLLAGLYPALLISSNRPLAALEGFSTGRRATGWIRRGLVIFQFAISIGLVVAVLAVRAQMHFIQQKDLGFNKDNLFVLKVNGYDEVKTGYEAFREELHRTAGIEGAATSNSLIIGGLGNGQMETEDGAGRPVSSSIYRLRVDYDYLDVYQIPLLAGRNFSRDFPADSTEAFLVNAAAIRSFGWEAPEAAIGKPVQMGDTHGRIVGVVDNFHFSSLHEPVQPVLLRLDNSNFSRITLRTAGIEPPALVSKIENLWKKHFPDALYDYEFFEKELLDQYKAEQRFARLFAWFSGLALFIGCLGLFGLAAYSAERRAKEISIRKVLGASVTQIWALLNADFFRLILLALVIAAPLAWLAMNRWLDNFAYRIDLQWWMVALAGGLAIGVALLTVSLQSVRAARANPVEALRDE